MDPISVGFVVLGGIFAVSILLAVVFGIACSLAPAVARLLDRFHNRERRERIAEFERRDQEHRVARAREDMGERENAEAQAMYRDLAAIACLPETRACPMAEQR